MRSRDFRPSSRQDGSASKPSNWLTAVRPFAPARPARPPAQVQRAEIDPETEPEEEESGGKVVQRTVDPDLPKDTQVVVTAVKYKHKYRTEAIVVRKSRQANHLVVRYEHIDTPQGADGFRFHIDDLDLAEQEEALPAIETTGAATEQDAQDLALASPNTYEVAKGKTVHIRRLPDEYRGNICHHYAFGGLNGPSAQFNIEQLSETLQATEEGEYGFPTPNFALLANNVVNVSAALNGVPNNGEFAIRVYGMAHSARFEMGRWWHKLNGLACLISIEGADNGAYEEAPVNLTIRSGACAAGAVGTFKVNQ